MNRIIRLFQEKQKNILSVYFTAGHPELDSTNEIIDGLEQNGVDMIEIGMPFSDPLADGPVIQKSSMTALKNGMSLNRLFHQLEDIRQNTKIPLLLMGYLNPVLRFGIDEFCSKCREVGIDGVILPDLPVNEYVNEYKPLFEKNNLSNIFLITPQTSEDRIRLLDRESRGFLYVVSSSSTTGVRGNIPQGQEAYFRKINEMKLENSLMIGFGISSRQSFYKACEYASGAIIGSAFIKTIENRKYPLKKSIANFILDIK